MTDTSLETVASAGAGRRPSYASWEDAVAARVVAVDGGHQRWDGTVATGGTPVVALRSQVETVYRLVFRWHHGREPAGQVRPTCAYPRCVAAEHLADRIMRAQGGAA